jgi:hypothetical protein
MAAFLSCSTTANYSVLTQSDNVINHNNLGINISEFLASITGSNFNVRQTRPHHQPKKTP